MSFLFGGVAAGRQKRGGKKESGSISGAAWVAPNPSVLSAVLAPCKNVTRLPMGASMADKTG